MIKLLLFILNLIFLAVCYSAYLNFFIPPSILPYFQYVAIIFPFLLLINFFFIVLWLLTKSYFPAILIIVFSVGLYGLIKNIYSWDAPRKNENTAEIKVMSYNVHYFQDSKPAAIDSLISSHKPTIVFLQEYRDKQMDSIPYFSTQNFNLVTYPYVGIATKYEVIDQGEILDRSSNGHVCYADVKIEQDTVRLISAYLEPFYLALALSDKNRSKEVLEKNTKKLDSQLSKTFNIHEVQLREMAPYIRRSPYPVILGGDLNAVPNSFEYFKLGQYSLKQSFDTETFGLGSTYYNNILPLRIDYLFTSKHLKTYNYKLIKAKLSDHYPIYTEVSLP